MTIPQGTASNAATGNTSTVHSVRMTVIGADDPDKLGTHSC
jgi:hypothetical protein